MYVSIQLLMKVILGVSGGIAAYKACELASLLKKKNIHVITILTEHACQFVTPLIFKTITNQPCYTDQFDYEGSEPLHIKLVREADAFVIAPATANIIAKISHGICDDLLSTAICAYGGLLFVAPAMNTQMWNNPITQKNLHTLRQDLNAQIIEPAYGGLACQTTGIGKLAPVESILEALCGFDQSLRGKKVLITAGGTRENIDPVRFIGNRSSGKMGIALADQAHLRGAEVSLISTSSIDNKPYQVEVAEDVQDMKEACESIFSECDICIMSAAVSDYIPAKQYNDKLKKQQHPSLQLSLKAAPDILTELSRQKKQKQILIGFAAESQNLLSHAKQKLSQKNIDMIIANDISRHDIGFAKDHNEVHMITRDSEVLLAKASKKLIASQIWDRVIQIFYSQENT